MKAFLRTTQQAFDKFLFESCNPLTCVLMRIGFAAVVIVNVLILMPDSERWFAEQGVLSVETAKTVLDGPFNSLFFWLTPTTELVQFCLIVWLLNCICMLLGIFSRFQVACIFIWMVSFQHRNPLIIDAQDTTMRMLAFFLIFMPLDYRWSASRWFLNRWRTRQQPVDNAWALRLVQLQMSLIYFSATVCKLQGATWRDGTALFYVSQLPAFFGKWPIPQFLLESEAVIRYGTWSVLALEGLVPLALWWKPTRKPAFILAIGLHLVLEYSMHTFLFQWIMIVGFLAFFNPSEWSQLFQRSQATDGPDSKQLSVTSEGMAV